MTAVANRDLAAECRDIARQADPVTRRAALCLAVILDASRTVDGARRMLGEISPQLRPAAEQLLGIITKESQ